ncbi:hypothetical protein [Niveibacterium sp. SC-1]|uniref:hypothetical protein n=1 Tax=Niveibacterium sp. SC-1 TaxID=3135646 RepID=UPI00311ED241
MKAAHPVLILQLMLARYGYGWPLVLIVAVMLAWAQFALLPGQAGRLRLEARGLAALRQTANRTVKPDTAPAPPARLATFEAALLPQVELKRFLVDAWDGAAVHAVRVTRTEYRIEHEMRGGFDRLLITIPAAGAYPDVRGYAIDLLMRYPGLALEKLQVKRELSASAEVEAELDLVLLIQPGA